MPGSIVSVPFLSQIEDMDKYLLEYRSLKLMPQNTMSFQHHQQLRFTNNNCNRTMNSNGGSNGNGRKKMLGNNNNAYRFNSGNSKYSQQTSNMVQPNASAAFKQNYPQLYYGANNNSNNNNNNNNNSSSSSSVSLPQVTSPSMYGNLQPQLSQQQVPQQVTQQFLTASSSSSSTPPPRLHASISGTSSISSLGSEFDYMMTNDFNKQYLQSVATNNTSNNFAFSHGYLDSGTAPPSTGLGVGSSSNTNDFMNGLPSSLLSDGSHNAFVAGSGNNSTAMFMSNVNPSYPSSAAAATTNSNDIMVNDSNSWGSTNANINSSSNTGSFGIWNNDMSVWS